MYFQLFVVLRYKDINLTIKKHLSSYCAEARTKYLTVLSRKCFYVERMYQCSYFIAWEQGLESLNNL